MQLEDVTELLHSHVKISAGEELLHIVNQMVTWDKVYSWWRWVNIVEMIEVLEYYINIHKAVVGFERIDFNFERISTVDKMLSISLACYRAIFHEKKESIYVINLIVVLS